MRPRRWRSSAGSCCGCCASPWRRRARSRVSAAGLSSRARWPRGVRLHRRPRTWPRCPLPRRQAARPLPSHGAAVAAAGVGPAATGTPCRTPPGSATRAPASTRPPMSAGRTLRRPRPPERRPVMIAVLCVLVLAVAAAKAAGVEATAHAAHPAGRLPGGRAGSPGRRPAHPLVRVPGPEAAPQPGPRHAEPGPPRAAARPGARDRV